MHRYLLPIFLTGVSLTSALAQTPTITQVANSASYTPAGLPNSGIAQGSLFIVKGANLGPAGVVIATSFPLTTTLAGTSAQVTVGGRAVSAIMYYTLAGQIAAILPSSTAAGTGTITVTYNNQTSAAFPITVVPSALGIFTVSQSGTGDAIAFLNSDNGLITPTHAANPGDVIVLWGTGLGPISGDETRAAAGGDMPGVPLEVYVGGRPATIAYRGRNACCSSVDTIYVTVPAGVAGCVVPVNTKIGNVVGNTTTIAVAAPGGRTCAATQPGTSTGDLSGIFNKPNVNYGFLSLSRTRSTTAGITVGPVTIPGQTITADSANAGFYRLTIPQGGAGTASNFDITTYGACTIIPFSRSLANPGPLPTITSLDAGPSIGLTGPGGARTLPKSTAGGQIFYNLDIDQTGSFLTAGQYTFTGTGGADVGAFSRAITIGAPLTWTNQDTTTTVNRASGVTVNWTGGDPGGYVQIVGSSFLNTGTGATATTVGATFTCNARTEDRSFTVPSYVLLALPASGSQGGGGVSIPIPGSLAVIGYTAGVTFTAPGLDYGILSNSSSSSSGVTYQ